MNDRLKFRVWHKKRKKMYEVLHLHTKTWSNGGSWVTAKGFNIITQQDMHINIEPSDCEIMQSTGLKDKNGKLIYEGDIVNVKIDGLKTSFIPMVVVWDRKEWQLKQYNKNFKQNCSACEVKTKQKCQYCSRYFQATGHTNFKDLYNNEVIGNIYENKELLNDR